ncbi:hypothetical protein LCGC14_0751690 [marine sediment metagenome]|uniref:DNA polymerase II small subunit n=1 Tax=marine sediment metagenome TaxID=412755 RepID=A0A0F9Q3Q2_9ZZZZ|nr:MAG: DNA polymerase D (II), small subunit [Candidatus Lokiarchaeum sp. GC14_75]
MNAERSKEKKIILRKLVNSGINITPPLLDIILELDDPVKNINLIIKESSFIASFKSHLTKNILLQLSNAEIKRVLKRKVINPEQMPTISQKINETNGLINSFKEISTKKDSSGFIGEIKQFPEVIQKLKQKKKPSLDIQKNKHIATVSTNESTKSNTSFKPAAKDYDSQFEILKDPTGKIFTNGGYNDFYDLTLNKFKRLQKLIRKRPEVQNFDNISNILRLSNQAEVSLVGLVNNYRKTKNGNFFLTLEDLTGLINVIIRKDSENQDNTKLAERTIGDQMVYVKGTYRPGDQGKTGIIFGNYITKIDVPLDYNPNKSNDPLSIALISDIHIGSKEFKEKLWNRFINFLRGKIGNKNQRERAGRIKYIIINGDLVDGIGIYPSQKNDLKITDIYNQFNMASKLLGEIPDYIKIFYSSGNHDPVRIAIPRPAVPKKYSSELIDIGVTCIGNPSLIKTHNVNTLVFHGDSILDLTMLIPTLQNNKAADIMKEFLKCRHMAPTFGKKTQIAPLNKDWLVIDKIPDIFHTGHIHINDMGVYNNIALVNSGCFQSQTDFMKSLGIIPTPGILSTIELDTLKGTQMDLKIHS